MTIGSNDWNGLTLANGRYLITSKLGEGGMGFVYRALDRNLDAEVVIKVPRQAMMEDPEFAGRFTREIRSLVKLSHPHIVKVTDVGTCEDTPFAVLQFLPGGSLEDLRPTGPDRRPLPCATEKVAGWLAEVAEALDYVHTQGYVHRDVKPGNILFDAQGHAFLSDFGVAKVLYATNDSPASQGGMTGTGMVLGTPEYMAPELIMGDPFDGRADQYALAITAYELLCGRRPFEDETKTRLLVLHSTKLPPRLTEWNPRLPEPLSQAVLKGLAKNPNDRYPNCAALAAAILVPSVGAVADDRVRIKCPGCGKVGTLRATELAKVKESGKRLACSACKTPLDLSAASPPPAAQVAGSGETMAVSLLGRSGEQARSRETGPNPGGTAALSARSGSGMEGPPHLPRTDPTTTKVISAAGAQGYDVLDAEPSPTPVRRTSQTVVERTPSPSRDAAATVVVKSSPGPESESLKPPRNQAHARDEFQVATSDRTRTWIALGAGATGALLVLGLVFWALIPRKDVISTATPTIVQTPPANSTSVNSSPAPAPQSGDRSELPTNTPAQEVAGLPATTGPDPSQNPLPETVTENTSPTTDASDHVSPPPAAMPPVSLDTRRPSRLAKRSLSKVNDVKPLESTMPGFDPALLDQPRKAGGPKVTLKKLLDGGRAYASQVLVPSGMFYLARSPDDNRDGERKYTLMEQQLRRGPRAVLEPITTFTTDLVSDPRLAAILDGLDLKRMPAIVTVWVTGAGDCMLVKAEILHGTTNRIHGRFKADINYWTLSVDPRKSNAGQGLDGDWEQHERFLLLKNNYKLQVEQLKKRYINAEYAQVATQMNAVFQSSVQSVVRQQNMQQGLQRQLVR